MKAQHKFTYAAKEGALAADSEAPDPAVPSSSVDQTYDTSRMQGILTEIREVGVMYGDSSEPSRASCVRA